MTTHPPRPDEGGVKGLERGVAGADEIDLLAGRPWLLEPQPHAADPLRDDVGRVEERVERAGHVLAHESRLPDPVHHDQELVQRELTAPEHPASAAREDAVHDPPET